jgi:hypothetical protein
MNADAEKPILFDYTFRFLDGETNNFTLQLDRRSLRLRSPQRQNLPDWTRLSYAQCPNCPLQADQTPHCPIAVNMVDLTTVFDRTISYDKVEVHLATENRHYTKNTSVQQALSSLLGIYMVTSGCPIMDKLRPLVRFHLPFATLEETAYRIISMYLTAQYLQMRRGGTPDWQLSDLVNIYEEVQVVNRHFSKRLEPITARDSSTNALAILDTFANYIAFTIDESMLDDLELVFSAYFDHGDSPDHKSPGP